MAHPQVPFAVLTLEDRRWLLPQGEVRTLESILDLDRHQPPPRGVGRVDFQGQSWPVYCPDRDLTPLTTLPPQRRVCVVLALGEFHFGILCDAIEILRGEGLNLQPLPPAMQSPGSPLRALVLEGEDRLALVTGAAELARYLGVEGEEMDHG